MMYHNYGETLSEVSCKERMKRDTIRYNRQLNNEISKLIDYQSTALEAAYFVKYYSRTKNYF